MTFEEFGNKVAKRVSELIPEYEQGFYIEDVVKANVGTLKGLVAKVEEGAVPVIYLESSFWDYMGGEDFETICQDLAEKYRGASNQKVPDVIDPDYIRANLLVKLLGYELNKEYLESYVHRKVDDYAIVPFLLVNVGDSEGEVKFSQDQFDSFEFNTDEIIDEAIERTRKLYPAVFNTLLDRTKSLFSNNPRNYFTDGGEAEKMMILTTTREEEGAIALYYPEVMDKIAMLMHGDYFVIPSSIHEFIVVRADEGVSGEALSDMVAQVNQSIVSENDWLGTRALRYDCKKGVLTA